MRGIGGTPVSTGLAAGCCAVIGSAQPVSHQLLIHWDFGFFSLLEMKLLKMTVSCFCGSCWRNTATTWECNREMQCMGSLFCALGSQGIADHAKKANSDLPGQRARKMHVSAFSLQLASAAVLFHVCGEGQMGAVVVWQPSQGLFAGIKPRHLWNRH